MAGAIGSGSTDSSQTQVRKATASSWRDRLVQDQNKRLFGWHCRQDATPFELLTFLFDCVYLSCGGLEAC